VKIIEYSKLEIATFLRDFFELFLISTTNPNIPFYESFKWKMKNDKRIQYSGKEYYNEMINIYILQLLSKYLTILYDNGFRFLQENKINSMNIPKDIFINSEDHSKFSNKQIIKYIRNALNHNDNNDLMKYVRVIDEGIGIPMIEIHLRNTKPVPFHIRVSLNTLLIIINEIKNANTINITSIRSKKTIFLNSRNCNNELNNIFIRKFYSRKKLTDEQLKNIELCLKEKKETINLEKKLSDMGLDYKDFNLTIAQKVKIMEDLKQWESMGVNGNDVIEHLISKVMPFSYMKEKLFDINLILVDYYMQTDNLSINDFFNDVISICLTKTYKGDSPLLFYIANYDIENFGLNNEIYYTSIDFDNIFSMVSSIYYGYIYDSLITDNEIIFSNRKIPRDRIRNSFVHMRWFKGIKECHKLFDWGNSIDDEFNKQSPSFWSANIPFLEMYNCTEKYYKEKLTNEKDVNSYMNFNIGFTYIKSSDGEEILNGIRLIKSGVLYSFSLNPNKPDIFFKLLVTDDSQNTTEANNEQKNVFINELDNLVDFEKKEYANIIKQIKEELLKSIINEQNYVDNSKHKH